MVGVRLRHAGGDGADADLGDELDRDARFRVGAAQVVDQLLEVLDRVDVVVGRRRDQPDARRGQPDAGDVAVDLVARQLAALARLRALGHLDLQLVGVRQIVDVDAEAPRGDLLDLRAALVGEAHGVLPAFTGVRAAAETVHRDRERLVRLARERAERHRAGREALDDLRRGLDLVERDRGPVGPEAQQAAQRRAARRVGVDGRGELVVRRLPAAAHRVLQERDRLRVPLVVLAVAAPRVEADDGQQLAGRARIGARMPDEHTRSDLVEPDAADAGGRAREVALDERGREADGLEDLRAAVGGDGRDPHLRDHLQEALADGLDRTCLGVLAREVDASLVDQLPDRAEHQVRVDGRRAVADQHGDALHAARLARLDDEAGLQARPRAHEMVVHRTDREQRGDRRALRPDGAVGEDEDVGAARERVVGVVAEALERRLETIRAVLGGPGRVERVGHEDVRVDLAQALELVVAQDRVVDHELARVLGRLVEQVSLRPDERLHRHHDRLAGRVDRRVRHLREELLEVGVEQRPPVGERGERRVVAHRADRLLGVDRERREHHLHVLLRVAERQLQPAQRLGRDAGRRARQVGEPHVLALEPGGVRLAGRDLALHLVVRDDAPLVEVDDEQLAGLQTSLAHDLGGRDIEHACLRREHHPAVAGLEPASRAQPVAVERRADQAPVGEGDRCRPVPRLGQAIVERVEAAQLVGHVGAPCVRLGHHHHQRVRQRASGEHEQLEHVVEDRGVRPALPDDGQHLLDVGCRRARTRAATRAHASS